MIIWFVFLRPLGPPTFRAAPDLYLWDGETIPLQVGYRFPSESWI
ncbi:cellulose biosynthesis cyclic di-GMP-binding regulatory protein BcsB, partial [Klebsiella pneumoniae]|nr:cellulose biosynthesis cyclic di-GMP-binding regulatory protein BcsB [Klebsiella pneumoniae]